MWCQDAQLHPVALHANMHCHMHPPRQGRGLVRRVPEDCPQGVADLWQACIVADPSARPSAADAQATLNSLQGVPRPAAAPATRAAPEPPIAASAGVGAPQAAERGAGAHSSSGVQAGSVHKPAAGSAIPGKPVNGKPVGGGSHEGQAAANAAAPEPDSGELGAAGGVSPNGDPKRSGGDRACSDSFASPLDVPKSV